jgi:hypothetical protein
MESELMETWDRINQAMGLGILIGSALSAIGIGVIAGIRRLADFLGEKLG